jgi:hypothetical protein
MQHTFSFLLSFFFFIFFFFFFFFLFPPHSFEIPPHSTDSCDSSPLSLFLAWSHGFLPFVRLSIYGSVYWKELISPLLVVVIWPVAPHPDKDGDACRRLCAHCFGRHLTSLVIQFPISRAQNELGTATPASPTCTAQAMTRKVDDGSYPLSADRTLINDLLRP